MVLNTPTSERIREHIIATVKDQRPGPTNIVVNNRYRSNIANGRLYTVDYTRADNEEVVGYVLRRDDEYIFFSNEGHVLNEVERNAPFRGWTWTPLTFSFIVVLVLIIVVAVLAVKQLPIPEVITIIASAAAGFMFGRGTLQG
jgi:hypothetical protein